MIPNSPRLWYVPFTWAVSGMTSGAFDCRPKDSSTPSWVGVSARTSLMCDAQKAVVILRAFSVTALACRWNSPASRGAYKPSYWHRLRKNLAISALLRRSTAPRSAMITCSLSVAASRSAFPLKWAWRACS